MVQKYLKMFGVLGILIYVTFGKEASARDLEIPTLEIPPPFICVDGTEILLFRVCNGLPDCADSSDELRKLCHHVVCPASMYRCAYGACVSRKSRCDGFQDCVDGSDEFLCDEAETCTDREYHCISSSECIPLFQVCNGQVDCSDGSDENASTCRDYPCPPHAFHCSYGGCVHQEVVCDGTKDCVDGTDEDAATCAAINCKGSECDQYRCSDGEFTCESGGQCVASVRVCDGTHQCRDGSDEDPQVCSARQCPAGWYRCTYGACIPEKLKCNLEPNCHDWSDEDEAACGKTLPGGACRLPSAKPGTHYQVVNCPQCRPGEVVPELSRLDFSCDVQDSLEGSSSIYCQDNQWLPFIPICPTDADRITCPALAAPGAVQRCEAKWGPRQGWVSCEHSVPVGTHVFLECPNFYEREAGALHTTCLHDGTWSQSPLQCQPTCGKRELAVAPLIVKGWTVSPDDPLPWHAALFSHEEGKWNFFCGGTLIAERAVLTAGHCVWKTMPETIRVILGSNSSDFNDQGQDSQVFDVARIELQESYQDHEGNYGSDLAILVLESPAIISSMVKPACIGAEDVSHMIDAVGLVSGMGLTENDTFSSTLRVTSAQVVSDEQCRRNQKRDFRKYLTYTSFCAGWGNGTGVCNGDSGGGLVLQGPNSTTWDVHGVVSISPRRLGTHFCDPNFYTVFTKVSVYAEWIREILSKLPVLGPPNISPLPNKDDLGN